MWVLRQNELIFQSYYETVIIRVAGQTSEKEECCGKSGIFELMKSGEIYWKQVASQFFSLLISNDHLRCTSASTLHP